MSLIRKCDMFLESSCQELSCSAKLGFTWLNLINLAKLGKTWINLAEHTELKCHKNGNFTKLKYHLTEMSPKLKCHHN